MLPRKHQLVPQCKATKVQGHRVRWDGEKPLVNGTVKEVKRDHVEGINTDTTERTTKMKEKMSVPKTYLGSLFPRSKVQI